LPVKDNYAPVGTSRCTTHAAQAEL